MNPAAPRLPNRTERLAEIGSTGSGKTVSSVWHLSRHAIDQYPWVIVDYKTDELINSIDRAQYIDLDYIPKKPGIYIVNPVPEADDVAVNAFLWAIWKAENIGVYVDEGILVTGMGGFNALLTQGRSKQIPMIVCTQRPVEVSRYLWSEASMIQYFRMNDARDRKTVQNFVPFDTEITLPKFHSYYHMVTENLTFRLKPVPSKAEILDAIDEKLSKRKKTI